MTPLSRFVRALDAAPDLLFRDAAAMLLVDHAGHLLRANRAAERLLGRGCVPGAAVEALFNGTDQPVVRRLLTALRLGAGQAGPLALANGVAVSADPVGAPGADGGSLLRLAITRPEESDALRLQAVGALAGLVAHDFNNLLTAILGAGEAALARSDPADAALGEDLRTIEAGARRGQMLVRQLLAYGREQMLQPRRVVVNEAITAVAALARRLVGPGIGLSVTLEQPGRDIWIDPGQLDQVLLNLVANARDAMPQGGALAIETGHATLVQSITLAAETLAPGRYVTITVRDTGSGIAPEILPRIFLPSFSTKGPSKAGSAGLHAGLGLASVHGIIRQSGGGIAVESRVGEGSCFCLYLPRYQPDPLHLVPSQSTAPAMSEPALVPARPATGRRLLLVEDEAALRRLAERTLGQRGWQVVSADSAEQALALRDSGGLAGLAVVVSDVVLPGLDGPALVARLRQDQPELPAIMVSGYADAALRAALQRDRMEFLAKPYGQRELGERVDRLFGAVP